jgi:pseudouridylate synthase
MTAFSFGAVMQVGMEATQRVVALESTLIAHGLPWPMNLDTAREAEAAVRETGAHPRTIAIVNGVAILGLDDQALQSLAAPSNDMIKAGRRDIATVIAQRRSAATTVSATLFLARSKGIGVMATGGLGGVHRGAATTFDISADLDELARADGMVVVCSGVKSILDIPATLEKLETLGVSVIGYRTDEFPAFTCRSSGISIEFHVAELQELIRIIQVHRALKLPGAIVVVQPVPEHLALDPVEYQSALGLAFELADREGIVGKAITPFLLSQLVDSTKGKSLVANRALIVENARLAGRIAAELATS